MLTLALSLASLFFAPIHASQTIYTTTSSPELSFQVTSGENDNFFYRDNFTSAQILLTSVNVSQDEPHRLIAALPAGNSGAVTYFLPMNSSAENRETSPLSVRVINGTFTSTTDDFDNAGIQVDLAFSGNATLGVTIIGGIRAIRDYVEGGQSMNRIFNYTLNEYNDTSVRLHRRYINETSDKPGVYKGVDLYISIPPESSARLSVNATEDDAPKIKVLVPRVNSEIAQAIRLRVLTNETSLTGLDPQSLFLSEDQATKPSVETALRGLSDGSNIVAQQVSFLTYADKFTAGGWRFLTYFGRDSLIALRLLMPIMTSEAIESALAAVIERTNTTGALCHEETIDLLLLPALAHYVENLPQGNGRAGRFLSRNATLQNGTYGSILNRISKYNYDRALPFYENQTHANLLAFRPGEPVGNWRDSNAGTGYGTIPFDVNAVLVPASLRATASLVERGLLDKLLVPAGRVAQVWEENAPKFFEVSVEANEAEKRLMDFVDAPNVDLGQEVLNGTTGENVAFYALSLREDGSRVEVLNSDVSFALMYGNNVSRTLLEYTTQALTPYPRGLLTNVGMVVANPAYDSNTTNIAVLDRTAYHGTVIWSFQQGLMAGGLARQLGFCLEERSEAAVDTNPAITPPTWCSDAEFLQSLQDAERRLWDSINGAPQNLYSEVWSYNYDKQAKQFSVADLSRLSGGTESDAIQLWSYGFLGLIEPPSSGTS
ncbi:hypothetical protein VNI00_011702 [Paramarasmius palmivorus]|uniref:Uncharacterized protein n=1 Tax=Paramarasmius palmivorus TaxID=297713 RepID=A0AAW0CBB8_9AGAR